MPMLKTQNAAGTFIYPAYKTGQIDAAHMDKKAVHVFVPDGSLPGDEWALTIEGEHGAIILDTYEDVGKLMIALEIALERIKAKDKLE